MPLYLYRKVQEENKEFFERGKKVSLAGYNLLYNLWKKKGNPVNQGWHVSLGDLVEEATSGNGNTDTHTLIIYLNPSLKNEIHLLELLDIWAYTYGKDSFVNWTPLMLRLREIYYLFDKDLTPQKKEKTIEKFNSNLEPNEDIFEFLYLQGDARGWNWGPVGNVNAPLLYRNAREFFRKHF